MIKRGLKCICGGTWQHNPARFPSLERGRRFSSKMGLWEKNSQPNEFDTLTIVSSHLHTGFTEYTAKHQVVMKFWNIWCDGSFISFPTKITLPRTVLPNGRLKKLSKTDPSRYTKITKTPNHNEWTGWKSIHLAAFLEEGWRKIVIYIWLTAIVSIYTSSQR